MKRYLVVGRGKTGTTAVSKTIQNTLGIANYHLEPRSIVLFYKLGRLKDDSVVKILYDHWSPRPRLLNAIIHNELDTDFVNVFITRDPRAEIISRLHYVALPYFQKARQDADPEEWLAIFRRKEQDPENVSLKEMVTYLWDNFNGYSSEHIRQTAERAGRYAAWLSRVSDGVKTMLRYEDFVSGNLAGHPLRDAFSGSHDVGSKLAHTRRTSGHDDWSSFILESDRRWIDELIGDAVEALGYDRHAWPERGPILPENSSGYVARIIAEARSKPRAA